MRNQISTIEFSTCKDCNRVLHASSTYVDKQHYFGKCSGIAKYHVITLIKIKHKPTVILVNGFRQHDNKRQNYT